MTVSQVLSAVCCLPYESYPCLNGSCVNYDPPIKPQTAGKLPHNSSGNGVLECHSVAEHLSSDWATAWRPVVIGREQFMMQL